MFLTLYGRFTLTILVHNSVQYIVRQVFIKFTTMQSQRNTDDKRSQLHHLSVQTRISSVISCHKVDPPYHLFDNNREVRQQQKIVYLSKSI